MNVIISAFQSDEDPDLIDVDIAWEMEINVEGEPVPEFVYPGLLIRLTKLQATVLLKELAGVLK